MNELLIGDFRVNIKRSEIIYQQNICTLEPKLLQVLLLLAEKPGEIVSHQEFQQKIWSGVVVEANTLQRCIAKLRKVFNDDAKGQKFITTHPKVGYSLVAQVNWQQPLPQLPIKAIQSKSRLSMIVILSLVLIVAVYWLIVSKPNDSITFSHISPVTTTDETEYRPSFSADGRYIVFQRFVSGKKNHLFAKDLVKNEEYRLTEQPGLFGKPIWSPDGSQVAFQQTIASAQSEKGGACDTIASVSFSLAKSSPQSPQSLYICHTDNISTLTWLDQHSIAFIAGDYYASEVRLLNINNQKARLLYKQKGQFIHSLAYTANNNQLAVLQASSTFSGELVLLNLDKNLQLNKVDKITLKPPESLSYHLWGEMSWHPSEDHLLVSYEHSLYKIKLSGKMVELPVPTYQTIYDPVYHPDGKKIAATLGIADFDINQISWQLDNTVLADPEVLYRSTVREGNAQYQPEGVGIAFLSKRSGNRQLWFATDNELKQLTYLEPQERIHTFIWSNKHNQLLISVNNQLRLISISGDSEPLNNSPTVLNIYQWLPNGNLLLKIVLNNQASIVKFDINSGAYQTLYQGHTRWAQLDVNNKNYQPSLYISDYGGNLIQVNNNKQENNDKLPILPIRGKFFIKADKLVFIGQQGGGWLYDLQSNKTERIFDLEMKFRKIDDIDLVRQRLLYQHYVSGKKEIVIIQ